MEKTVYVNKTVKTLEATNVLPRTLETKVMPYTRGEGEDRVEGSMFGVYGADAEKREAWVATFADIEEAQSWILGSKTFGRPVLGLLVPTTNNVEASNGETGESSGVSGSEQPSRTN